MLGACVAKGAVVVFVPALALPPATLFVRNQATTAPPPPPALPHHQCVRLSGLCSVAPPGGGKVCHLLQNFRDVWGTPSRTDLCHRRGECKAQCAPGLPCGAPLAVAPTTLLSARRQAHVHKVIRVWK